MLSRLGRAGLALAAAGALGICPLASAQAPPAAPPAALAAPVQTAPSRAQQDEALRVELAWLGHPTTFGYGLTAVPVGGALEARGFVPTEAVREQAVAVARQTSTLHVHDRLSVHTGLSARAPGGTL